MAKCGFQSSGDEKECDERCKYYKMCTRSQYKKKQEEK